MPKLPTLKSVAFRSRAIRSRPCQTCMVAHRREQPQTTESGAVVGPARSLCGVKSWKQTGTLLQRHASDAT